MWFGFWMIQYQNLLFIRIKCQTITAWPAARLFIQKFSLYNLYIVKNIASLVTISILPAWSPQIYVEKAITRIILIVLSLYQISRKYMIYAWQCKSYIGQPVWHRPRSRCDVGFILCRYLQVYKETLQWRHNYRHLDFVFHRLFRLHQRKHQSFA